MIFLMQAGLTQVLNKYNVQKKITTEDGDFIPFIGYSFYEMEINDKIDNKNDLISTIHNIIAKQIKYNYCDFIISIPYVSMQEILNSFNYEIAKFQYYYLHSKEYLKLFLQSYNLEDFLTIKVIDDISIYPVILKENSQNSFLELIQTRNLISNEYLETIIRSFNNDSKFLRGNYEKFKAFDVDIINSIPNLYETIYNCIYSIKKKK